MTDKEILDTVHRWMNQSLQRDEPDHFHKRRLKDCKDFIEQEWQEQDHPLTKSDEGQMYNIQSKSLGKFSDSWYSKDEKFKNRMDVGERHRGLDIDEDGTVTNLK